MNKLLAVEALLIEALLVYLTVLAVGQPPAKSWSDFVLALVGGFAMVAVFVWPMFCVFWLEPRPLRDTWREAKK